MAARKRNNSDHFSRASEGISAPRQFALEALVHFSRAADIVKGEELDEEERAQESVQLSDRADKIVA